MNHLIAVWNPSYERDAMEAHIALLLRAAREYRAGARDEDDVYVWWGKVRSANRQQPLPHLGEILSLDEQLAASDDEAHEAHLYLTDYRSLYVAHLAGITADDMSEETDHVPEYYRAKSLSCDCWFQLWDIRRVVLDDTPAVVEELKKLRNTRYHDRPVSLYGGMVELPLIVTRADGARYFDQETRDLLTGGRHWVEFDAERGGVGGMQRELRENRFGSSAWTSLDPAARAFIATAESLYRAHRDDAAFDFSPVILDLAKALEVQCNAILRSALAGAPAAVRTMHVDGVPVDLSRATALGLGALARAIGHDRDRCAWLRRTLRHGDWFVESLPQVLEELAPLRNDGAHSRPLAREDVAPYRE
ncbi:MAG TPA: hypothetical protein VFS44_09715, partial [Gemmatimonadaceae bacterium]|nr:hypothetical protein [Gemmatimonadaceae bacterium]